MGNPFFALALALAAFAFPPPAVPAGPAAPAAAAGPKVAITIDDLPVHGPLPEGETRVGIARKMLAALRAAGVRRAYGFVNGAAAGGEPGRDAVLKAWRKARQPLGNHTWSHVNLNEVSVPEYEREIVRNEPLLVRLAGRAGRRWFRYPFLAEGDDPAKRAEIRRFLAARSYRIAAVTMEFGDYAWNDPYARCAAKGDAAAIAALEKSYLDSARASMRDSRMLAHSLYGRDIPYVLLLHIGAFDARMLPRLLALLREEGFGFISLPAAERDPFYAQDVDPWIPAGPSGLAGRAGARGLNVPPRRADIAALDGACR
jgi:peptidoglycan/xylan/chitin deacetylase (PgdA/CDA1 family)